MAFSTATVQDLLVKCHRRCCLCHRYCGSKMEIHHIIPRVAGGNDGPENAIPLCFDCHAEVESYNAQHPKGRRFSPEELRGHRDEWFRICREQRIPHIFPSREAIWAYSTAHTHLSVDSDSCLWYELAEENRKTKYKRHFCPADWFYCLDVIDGYREWDSPRKAETIPRVRPFESLPHGDKLMLDVTHSYVRHVVSASPILRHVPELAELRDFTVVQFYEYTINNTWIYRGSFSEHGFTFNLGLLQQVMPSPAAFEEMRITDPITYNSLKRFSYRFLRTSDPIFDFIVENNTDNATVITGVNVHVKDKFSYPKGPSGAGGLAPVSIFQMQIDFTQPCNSLAFDPPVRVSPRAAGRFKVRFVDFYANATDNNLVVSFELLFGQNEPTVIDDVYLDY